MKRILAFLVAATLFCGMCVSAEAVPAVSVGSVTAYAGDTVSIPVSLENNPGINSFTLGVQYDSESLRFDGFSYENTGLSGSFEAGGKIVWLNTTDSDYNGEIFTLEFTVLDTAAPGQTAVTVTYEKGDICNFDMEDIDFAVSAGSVNIAVKGDVDTDGDLDADDLVKLRKILLGISEATATADVNGDINIDICDLVAIKKLL